MPAHALDLTASGSSGFVNDGVFFQQTSSSGAGTGNISSYLRVQANSTEEGYNSGFRDVEFDEDNSLNFNRDLFASQIPVVTIGDIKYAEFLLDINQPNGQGKSGVDLEEFRIFQHAISNITNGNSGGTFNGFAGQSVFEIFRLDEVVKLNDLNSGSGSIDYTINVPLALFDLSRGSRVTTYAYFTSSAGGFEEFAVQVGGDFETVPTPALLPGLFGMGIAALRKRRNNYLEEA